MDATAQQLVGRIIASVNDDAITDFDVDGRIRLIAASANTPLNAETQQRFGRIALRELIDDRLKAQEAKRLGITANDKEVGAAVQTIERNNQMAPGGLLKELTEKEVPIGALLDQLKASILWRKVLRRRVLPQVRVATNEVDDALSRIEPRDRDVEILGRFPELGFVRGELVRSIFVCHPGSGTATGVGALRPGSSGRTLRYS